MQKVVIVGGTGFVGRSLVRALASNAGYDVSLLTRDAGSALTLFPKGVRAIRWTLDKGEGRTAWEREVKAANVVVNLAGAGVMDEPWTAERKIELRASRVDVTRALAETLAKREPGAPPTFVSASAIGIYGAGTDDAVVAEDSPAGSDFLAELCVAWEAAADPARNSGVRVVHPRLGIVLGQEGGALPLMARPFKLHLGGPVGDGRQWVSWVHETDVTRALEHAVSNAAMEGAYNVVAPKPVTMQALAEAIAGALGTHAKLRAPAFAVRAVLGEGRADAVLTGRRVSSQRLVRAGCSFAFPDVGAAVRDLLKRAG